MDWQYFGAKLREKEGSVACGKAAEYFKKVWEFSQRIVEGREKRGVCGVCRGSGGGGCGCGGGS